MRRVHAPGVGRAHDAFAAIYMSFDDTFSQTIYQRTSYIAGEIRWGARFKAMTIAGADGRMEMDVNLVDATEAVEG